MLALAFLLGALGAGKPPEFDVRAVLAVLERHAADDAAPRLARELAALGPASIPDLFAVLALGTGLERALLAGEEEALTQALVSFGAAPLRSHLGRCLSDKPEIEERWTSLRLLARAGTSDDVTLLRQAVQASGAWLADGLQEAATGILRRDPRALEALRRWTLEAPIDVGAALARAVARSDAPQAMAALVDTLGYRVELDAELLGELAPLVARAAKPLDEELLAPLQEALDSDDARVLRPAALALGHAQHPEALARLIVLLEHENRGVRAAAEWALGNVTGLRFRADAQRWRGWLETERSWFEQHGPALRAELRSATPQVVIRALGELTSHPWRRHELALEAVDLLEHESPLVRRLTCLALTRLGSRTAEAPLRRALEDADESVVEAARHALRALGAEVPGPAARHEAAISGEGSRTPSCRPTMRPRVA